MPRPASDEPPRSLRTPGDRVALLARGETGLDAARAQVERAGGHAVSYPVDVADFDAVDRTAQQIEETLGPIDIWVNVAFASVFAPFWEITPTSSGGSPTSPTSATCTARWPPCAVCGPGTMAWWCRWARRWENAASRCSPPTAGPSTPSTASPRHCAASSCTTVGGAGHRGADAGRQHATVLLGPHAFAPPSPAGAPHLPTRGGGRAVVFAADHPEAREYWVGGSTAATILANRTLPGILDRYLARTGFRSQQTDQAVSPERPDNLVRTR